MMSGREKELKEQLESQALLNQTLADMLHRTSDVIEDLKSVLNTHFQDQDNQSVSEHVNSITNRIDELTRQASDPRMYSTQSLKDKRGDSMRPPEMLSSDSVAIAMEKLQQLKDV